MSKRKWTYIADVYPRVNTSASSAGGP